MSPVATASAGTRPRMRATLVRAAVSLALLGGLLWWLSTPLVLERLRQLPPALFAAVVGLFLAGHALSALKWRLLVRAAGAPLGAADALRAHAAGLFANLCLPSIVGGDVVRGGLAAARAGRVEAVALGSLADRAIDTAALVAIAGVAALGLPAASGVAGRVLVASGLLLAIGSAAGGALVAWLPAERLPVVLRGAAARLRGALGALLARPGAALAAAALSLAVQCGFVVLNVWLARALGLEVDARVWFLVWPLAKLVSLLPVSLGGLGVREVALAAFLTPFGVEAALAVAQSLSWQAVLIVAGGLAGFGAWSFGASLPLAPPRSEEAS